MKISLSKRSVRIALALVFLFAAPSVALSQESPAEISPDSSPGEVPSHPAPEEASEEADANPAEEAGETKDAADSEAPSAETMGDGAPSSPETEEDVNGEENTDAEGEDGGVASGELPEPERPEVGLAPPAPRLLLEPEYPVAALSERLAVSLQVMVYIGEDGSVVKAEILTPTADKSIGFEDAATEAMMASTFWPALRDGKPIAAKIPVNVDFYPPDEALEAEIEAPVVLLWPECGEEGAGPECVEPVEVEELKPEPPPAAKNVLGQVLERGTRRQLSGVLVTLEKDEVLLESYTDETGSFSLAGVEPGSWKVTIEEDDFGTFSTEEEVVPGQLLDVTYYIERAFYDAYGTEGEYVYETRERRMRKEVTRRTIQVAEIQRIPGNQGDALKVVQNLPGVARSTFNSGAIVVRGSAPEDTQVLLNGVGIPLLYHFGGLTAVVNSDILESIDFFPGNFSVRYGRAMGGILDVKTRRPNTERYTGYVDIDVIDASALIEGPITEDLSFQLSARRSYFDVFLPYVIPEDAGGELTVAPRYWDYQGRLNWRPMPGHEFEFFVYGSDDVLEFVLDAPPPENPTVRGSIEAGTSFHRAQLEYRFKKGALENVAVLNMGTTVLDFAIGDDLFFLLDLFINNFREELSYSFTDWLKLTVGLDMQWGSALAKARFPDIPEEGEFSGGFETTDYISFTEDSTFYQPATFVELETEFIEGMLFTMGGRLDYDRYIGEYSFDPRASARYEFSDYWAVKGGVGLFSQAPQPQESTLREIGNPDLTYEEAMHYSGGAEVRLPFYEPVTIDLVGFYKDMSSLITASDEIIEVDGEAVSENFNNEGVGRVYGMELLARHELANNFFGWIAYTLSKAERQDGPGEEWRPFEFDQTHILTMIASYKLPDQWQIGLRFRYVTGRPFTPRAGSVYDADGDGYQEIPGEPFSARIEGFHQLDLRVDKSWIYDLWRLSAYLDIQGVYYHANPEAVTYNYDSTEYDYVRGLPILPSIGVKGEF